MLSNLSGVQGRMEDSKPPSPGSVVRKCANIKSRKIPDLQCNLNATNGDYCSRHWKHPHKFVAKTDSVYITTATRKQLTAIQQIQRAWRLHSSRLFIRGQGPGVFQKNKSVNETELYSLEPVQSIPNLYYFSFVDSNKKLWSFDIRTLGQIISFGDTKQNPYTRDTFSTRVLTRIRNRLTWLRRRKYSVLYPANLELTAEQLWFQKVLDIFMKIESFGYYVSCEWFTNLTVKDHKKFYETVYELWMHRLGLTAEDRLRIAPGGLFKHTPTELASQRIHTKQWWDKLNLALIEGFLTRSTDKENQKLGATYCVMGLAAVSPAAAESFPWLTALF